MTDKSTSRLSRRDFIKLTAATGGTAVGGYLLAVYAPWIDYDGAAEQTWTHPEKEITMQEAMLGLVRCATLAANGHNAQAWKFAVTENEIQIRPDFSRRLAVVDPQDREMWISLGCALENLLAAARATGFRSEVTYPDLEEAIRVRLEADTPRPEPLFDAIPLRRNTRSKYDGRPVGTEDFARIQALPLEPGVSMSFATSQADLKKVAEYLRLGCLQQYSDRAFLDELIHWMRFTRKDALASSDGLFSACSGNPEVPRWLGKMVVAGLKAEQQAQSDVDKLLSSAGAVVIASEADNRTAWVRAGQVYERLALTFTGLGVQSAFLNQPIEVAEIREQFQSALGLGNTLPQLLVRYGYGKELPRSLRRPVEDVLA